MSSNSIRVGAELFALAQQQGALMSRSAAQQVEHWARLGVALEATGLSVASEQSLWAFKRQRQAEDLRSVRAGRQPAAAMSWFAGGRAKAAKLVNSPY